MKKIFMICWLASFAVSASAVDLLVINGDMGLNAHNDNPTGWTVIESSAGSIYVWDDTISTDKRLAFKDTDTITNSIEQVLTTTYPSLSVEDCGNWTVGFDYGWRTDIAGGDCEFTVRLVDADTDTVLDSTNLVIVATGNISNVETPVGTASLSLSYNTGAVTAGHAVAVRIERTDAADSVAPYKSTSYIDNITVAATDLTTAPALAPPIWKENPVIGMNALVDAVYSNSVAGLASDVESETITYGKTAGAAWLTVAADGTLSGTPSAADGGTTNVFEVSATSVNGTSVAALNIYVKEAFPGILLTLLNADFEGGQVDGNNPADWTTIETHAGAFYAENWGAGAEYGATLNLQARGDGNIVQQSFLTSEITADSYGTIDVTMDLGIRAATGIARSLDVEIWNITDDTSLASETYAFPTTGTGFLERKTFSLTYDNTAASLVGDEIALRITSNGEGDTWNTTYWIDNIEVGVIVEVAAPATILSVTAQSRDIMRIVIDAPNSGALYWPKAKSNLIIGSWEGVAHSVDGSAPWYVTNLSYVTEFESGTNEVIYVQADEAQKFFEIIGD